MTKADMLAQALDDFLAVSAEVEAAAVVSVDGLPMASALPAYVEEDRLAAMSAALLTLGERAATNLGKGGLSQVFVEGEDGHVILMAAGTDAVFVTVTSTEAKVGLVLFEMRRIAGRIAEIMMTPPPEVDPLGMSYEPEQPVEQVVQPSPPLYRDENIAHHTQEATSEAETAEHSVSAWE
ncbi:MAG: roadblock/LC7 domain-containing protein [Actinomycetota bacterium]